MVYCNVIFEDAIAGINHFSIYQSTGILNLLHQRILAEKTNN